MPVTIFLSHLSRSDDPTQTSKQPFNQYLFSLHILINYIKRLIIDTQRLRHQVEPDHGHFPIYPALHRESASLFLLRWKQSPVKSHTHLNYEKARSEERRVGKE